MIYFILILSTFLNSQCVSYDKKIDFWIELELKRLEWIRGCLNTADCINPRIVIRKTNLLNNEELSISWRITAYTVKVSLSRKISEQPTFSQLLVKISNRKNYWLLKSFVPRLLILAGRQIAWCSYLIKIISWNKLPSEVNLQPS